MMHHLWSPWRMKYLLEPPPKSCIFCERARTGDDERDLIVFRGRHHYLILNLYPYSTGHLMLVTNRHAPDLAALSAEERAEAAELLVRIECVLGKEYGPAGANLGVNLGRCAGAGVEGHFHLHYVPRRSGDTEDGSSRSATEPPEELQRTLARLRKAFAG